MTIGDDRGLLALALGVLALLVAASLAGWVLSRRQMTAAARATVDNINARVRAWWVMAGLFIISVTSGAAVSLLLFSLVSFLALREFVTLAPTRPGDHRALVLVVLCRHSDAVLPGVDPVVRTVQYPHPGLRRFFLPFARRWLATPNAFSNATADYQWGLMICVYFVSYVPAVLMLDIPGYERRRRS